MLGETLKPRELSENSSEEGLRLLAKGAVWWALNLFTAAQALVDHVDLGSGRGALLLAQQFGQVLVVPYGPPPLALAGLAAHQLPVGLLQVFIPGSLRSFRGRNMGLSV